MIPHTPSPLPRALPSTVMLAGLAGGLAEVLWVGGYCALTPLEAGDVLREIALAAGLAATPAPWLPLAGLAVHFALSLAIAAAFCAALTRMRALRVDSVPALAALVLLGIWSMNFLLVLPVLAPQFVELMPMTVTAVSKLFFGLAMGAVLYDGFRHAAQASAAPARIASRA